ncbi:MAG: acyl-CoA thioesterase [Anaerolineae bacterium]|nr:acyl-CoA thioesterase [Anaerolineae bacterium]
MIPSDKFVTETTLYVRYAETDAMGIVHHASYIIYFEEGRSNYARQRGSDYARFEAGGHYLTVAEVNARYIKPARYGQQIVIRCWISEMKTRGLTFSYELGDANTNETLVTGYSKHICITHTGQVAHLPEEWRHWGTS